MEKEIPIFFSCDDSYIPYLDVAIKSLIENASQAFEYKIVVLNTGLKEQNVNFVKANEKENFKIDFVDISREVENIKSYLKNVYHFSVVTYYRLFIASLFPQYDKVLYLDCDIVVLGDVSELYFTDLGDNILGGVPDKFVRSTEQFRLYAERAIGVDARKYINAGVLLMNLRQFRKCEIERRFITLITEYDFDLLDPDQAYLNYLCFGKIHALENTWNSIPSPLPCDEKKDIVHFALYKKPWQYDDVKDGEYFWQYAKKSPFYEHICKQKLNEAEIAEKQAAAAEILEHALKIVNSDYTFFSKLSHKH